MEQDLEGLWAWFEKACRTLYAALSALVAIRGPLFHARLSKVRTPVVKTGLWTFRGGTGEKAFEIQGRVSVYWTLCKPGNGSGAG
jgi:hypothetical protein